jgi:hypothetical protein
LALNQGSLPDDDTLVSAAAGRILAKRRARSETASIRAGNLIVRITAHPIAIRIDTPGGTPIQRLTLDAESPVAAFMLGKGPLFGLGEGGPQFDRKGIVDRGRNGQGGYQLRTHGGRVPIQWLVSTDGWGMFIHQPVGAFDLTGAEGRLIPAADAAPLDVFVTASSDPKVILGEYARIMQSCRRAGRLATCSRIARWPGRTT